VAQDITGTALAANSVAQGAKPLIQTLFDWADDGFGNEGDWTDETTYLKSASGRSRAVGWGKSLAGIGVGVADDATLVLKNVEETGGNSGFRFSQTNANGSLYASIGEGAARGKRAAVKLGYYNGATPQSVYMLKGYLESLQENYRDRQVTITLRDRAMAAALSKHATTLQQNQTAAEYLATIAALMDRDPPGAGEYSYDTGYVLLPYAWLEDEPIWKEMGLVAESQGGRIWFDHAGVLRFEDGTHFVRARADAWRNPLVSQFTFTTNDFQALNPHYEPHEVVNHVIVEYSPRYTSFVQIVYTAAETFIVPPSGSITVRCEHRYPVASIATPAASTDFKAGTAGGTDLTDDITLTLTTKAIYTDVEIANANADYAAYIYKLQLRGYPVLSEQPIKYECEDATSIAKFGRQTLPIRNPYVVSYRHAQSIGDLLLARFKDPPLLIELSGVPGVPYLEPGDRITVTETKTGINTDFVIGELDWRFDPGGGGGLIFREDIQAVRASDMYPYSDYFVLGTSEFGDDDGRLFW